jgi:hypothetical protein
MILPGEGVRPQAVPMTPNGNINWLRTEIPSLCGSLYQAPDADEATVRQVADVVAGRIATDPLGEGYRGKVFTAGDPDVIIKQNKAGASFFHTGLNALRANVALHGGLEELATQGENVVQRGPVVYKVTSPKMYAGYIPDEGSEHTSVWAMSRMPNARLTRYMLREHGLLPQVDAREQVYTAALATQGLEPGDVELDDCYSNTHVRHIGGRAFSLIKLDVAASPGFESRMRWR